MPSLSIRCTGLLCCEDFLFTQLITKSWRLTGASTKNVILLNDRPRRLSSDKPSSKTSLCCCGNESAYREQPRCRPSQILARSGGSSVYRRRVNVMAAAEWLVPPRSRTLYHSEGNPRPARPAKPWISFGMIQRRCQHQNR
jgi:hypothetical protein